MPLTPEHFADAWTHGLIAGVAVVQVVSALAAAAALDFQQ